MEALVAADRLSRVDARVLTTLAARLRTMCQHVREAADGVAALASAGSLSGWSGSGHDAFARAAATLRARLARLGDAFEVAASALSSLGAALEAVQGEARAASRVLAVAGPTDPGREVASELAGALAAFDDADARAAFLLGETLLIDLARAAVQPRPPPRADRCAGARSAGVRRPSRTAERSSGRGVVGRPDPRCSVGSPRGDRSAASTGSRPACAMASTGRGWRRLSATRSGSTCLRRST